MLATSPVTTFQRRLEMNVDLQIDLQLGTDEKTQASVWQVTIQFLRKMEPVGQPVVFQAPHGTPIDVQMKPPVEAEDTLWAEGTLQWIWRSDPSTFQIQTSQLAYCTASRRFEHLGCVFGPQPLPAPSPAPDTPALAQPTPAGTCATKE